MVDHVLRDILLRAGEFVEARRDVGGECLVAARSRRHRCGPRHGPSLFDGGWRDSFPAVPFGSMTEVARELAAWVAGRRAAPLEPALEATARVLLLDHAANVAGGSAREPVRVLARHAARSP